LNNTSDKIVILGSGLAGSLLSSMLADRGFKVEVYEKRADPRSSSLLEGRSINLALSHRGINALKYASAFESIKPSLIPMMGRMMHDAEGNLTYQAYGNEDQYINSVSRNDLNCNLISIAEAKGVTFHFNRKCVDISFDEMKLTTQNQNGDFYNDHAEVIIGSDGAFSALRNKYLYFDRFSYSQQYIEHGYKEFRMPSIDNEFAMEENYLHIWPRGNYMMIALPNPDKSFTCTLFYPFEGANSFNAIQKDDDIEQLFEKDFRDMKDKIPDYLEQYNKNPASSLVTVRCFPWNYKNTMVIGDAAHAIVPFYGQGMNAAFEDCRLLVEMGEKLNFEWEVLFDEFSRTRKKDADAIADLALKNFIEMRDQVADDGFLERKKADALLHQQFKDDWIPMYTQVSFTDIPYSEAKNSGILQEKAMIECQKQNKLSDLNYVMQYFRNLSQGM